jgi:hypothetical protein
MMHRQKEILNFALPLLEGSFLADYAGQFLEDK